MAIHASATNPKNRELFRWYERKVLLRCSWEQR